MDAMRPNTLLDDLGRGTLVAVAAATLVLILLAFGLIVHGLPVSYDAGGSGCRELSASSRTTLNWALLLPRLALIAWFAVTAAVLEPRSAAELEGRRFGPGSAAVGAALLGALAAFGTAGHNALAGMMITALLWACAVGGVIWSAVALHAARRRQGRAPWTALWPGWWLMGCGAAPAILTLVAGSSEIPIC